MVRLVTKRFGQKNRFSHPWMWWNHSPPMGCTFIPGFVSWGSCRLLHCKTHKWLPNYCQSSITVAQLQRWQVIDYSSPAFRSMKNGACGVNPNTLSHSEEKVSPFLVPSASRHEHLHFFVPGKYKPMLRNIFLSKLNDSGFKVCCCNTYELFTHSTSPCNTY